MVKDSLFHREMGPDDIYPQCANDIKVSIAASKHSSKALEVWSTSPLAHCITSKPIEVVQQWLIAWFLKFRKEDGQDGNRFPVFCATLWGIWCARNNTIVRNQPPSTPVISTLIENALRRHKIFSNSAPFIYYFRP